MNPTVVAVMLTRDRHELAKKAVQCFDAQTYPLASLLVFDTGEQHLEMEHQPQELWCDAREFRGEPIGTLRNAAITLAVNADVIVHWDDDDYAHPNRITEQLELLQASGAGLVGYNEMLFWREGEAWLYTGDTPRQTLGTSFCYWRKTWEARRFNPQLPRKQPGGGGEDWDFLRGRHVEAESSIHPGYDVRYLDHTTPRMIARIHGGNSSNGYQGIEASPNWKRVPDWDDHVREILK